MENFCSTPLGKPRLVSRSEPEKVRTPLSSIKSNERVPATPVSRPSVSDNSAFEIDMLEGVNGGERYCKLPLPLLVKPSIGNNSKNLSQILNTLRSKAVKSILKPASQIATKTVHFSESVNSKEKLSEIKTHSLTTTSNSVTESRLEPAEEEKNEFKYEEEIRSSILIQDYDEYPTVSFCRHCTREVVTSVRLEKIRPSGGFSSLYWAICWCFPPCLYSETELVHRCSLCANEIIRVGN